MVFRCCVRGCKVVATNGLHSFPANKSLAEKWIMAISSPELMDRLNANNLARSHKKVCKNHFIDSDFQSDVIDGKSRLKTNSIPSVSLPDATINIRIVHPSMQKKPVKRLQQPKSTLYSIGTSKQIKDGQMVEVVKKMEISTHFPSLEYARENSEAEIAPKYTANCRRCENLIHLQGYGINETVRDIFNTKNIVILCDECLLNIDNEHTKPLSKNIDRSSRRSKNTGQTNITRKMHYLKMRVQQLKMKVKSNKLNDALVINYLSKKFNKQQLEFVKMQITNSGRSKHGRRYTPEQKSLCLAIYKQGPKSYRFKEKIFILPTKKTLGRHSARLLFKSGVDSKVLDAIKNIVKDWPETDRYCSLSWDEVSLKEHLDYCHSSDLIEGFVELHESRRPTFATHALTFMIRGIKISFKQAVAYFYTNGLNAFELVELVKLMIDAVSSTGLVILLSVCDQVYTNGKTVNMLVNPARPKYQEGQLLVYTIKGRKIIHSFDPSHLIKTVRNNFETKNLNHHISERWNNDKTDNKWVVGSLQTASWEHLSTLYKIDTQSPQQRLRKLSKEHLKPNKLKMKVSLATQVFSNTCGNVMNRCIEEKQIPENFADTAKILLFMNDVFDSMNGSKNLQEGTLKSAVTPNSIHFSFWEYALLMLSNMNFVDKLTGVINNRSSILKRIESTIKGYIEFAKTCFKLNIFNVSIRDTSQDGLENFFGCVQTCNQQCKATPQQYRTGFATMTINNITGTNSLHSNCEQDTSNAILTNIHEFILDCETNLNNSQADVSSRIDDVNEMIVCNSECDHDVGVVEEFEEFEDMDVENISIFDTESEDEDHNTGNDYVAHDLDNGYIFAVDPLADVREINFIENEALSYTSSSICQKLMKFSKCQNCKDYLNLIAEYNTNSTTENTFIRNCKRILRGLNDIIPFICSENSIKEKLIEHTKSIQLDSIGCPEHDSEMSQKLIELCAYQTITTFCCDINKFLSGKTDALPENHMQKLARDQRIKKKKIGKYTDIFNKQ